MILHQCFAMIILFFDIIPPPQICHHILPINEGFCSATSVPQSSTTKYSSVKCNTRLICIGAGNNWSIQKKTAKNTVTPVNPHILTYN